MSSKLATFRAYAFDRQRGQCFYCGPYVGHGSAAVRPVFPSPLQHRSCCLVLRDSRFWAVVVSHA
jgi:hypothetical protein